MHPDLVGLDYFKKAALLPGPSEPSTVGAVNTTESGWERRENLYRDLKIIICFFLPADCECERSKAIVMSMSIPFTPLAYFHPWIYRNACHCLNNFLSHVEITIIYAGLLSLGCHFHSYPRLSNASDTETAA